MLGMYLVSTLWRCFSLCVHLRVIYVWGYNGYCRLGLGNQVDALKPKVVPQVCIPAYALLSCKLILYNPKFSGPNDNSTASAIAAGPTSSVVVDKQGMFYIAGKVRKSSVLENGLTTHNSGKRAEMVRSSPIRLSAQVSTPTAGSSGSPHSTFRFIQDIMYACLLHYGHAYLDGSQHPCLCRGCKVLIARSGGVTHWLVTPDDDGSTMTVCWGQNANNG
jgi:alpha-tubulin suppressor-like RCC1 family protein